MRHFLKRPAAAPGILAAHSPFTSLTLAVLSAIALGAAPLHDANAAEADDEAVDAEAAAGSQDAPQNPASAEEADLFLPEVVVSADSLNGLESGGAGSGGNFRTGELSEAKIEAPTSFASSQRRPERGTPEPSGALEMASEAPGTALREQGMNQPTALSLRGSSPEQVGVRLAGMNLKNLRGGGFDLSRIPAAFIERVSVVRGAVGAHYGEGALGGAVDVELVSPRPGQKRVMGEIAAGSFETFEGALGGAVGLQKTSVFAGISAKSSRGNYPFDYDPTPLDGSDSPFRKVRENNALKRIAGLFRVKREGALRLDILGEAGGSVRGSPGAVQAPTLTAEEREASAVLSVKAGGDIADGMELSGNLSAQIDALQWSPDRSDRDGWQDEEQLSGGAEFKKYFDHHELTLSASLGADRLSGPHHGTHHRLTGFVKAGDVFDWGPLTLTGTLRAQMAGGAWGLTPLLGAKISPWDFLSFSANTGRSFRAPSFGELYLEQGGVSPNEDLREETATFADAGAELSLPKIGNSPLGLRVVLDGFWTRYDEIILYELYAPMRVKPYNMGRADTWGMELEGEATAKTGPFDFRLTAAWTWAGSKNAGKDERYRGNELPFHPRHRFRARASAGLFQRLEIFAVADFQGAQKINRSNMDSMAGHWRFDAGLSATLHKRSGLQIGALAMNIANAQGQDIYGYPLTGRSFRVTLGFDLGWPDKNASISASPPNDFPVPDAGTRPGI